MASDDDTPHKTLTSVPLNDVRPNEHIALEMLDGGGYDTRRHPPMARRRCPVYHRENDEWVLLSSYGDAMFESTGAVKHQTAIRAYLETLGRTRFADVDIAAYNAQAGDDALVPNLDYSADDACTLPKTRIGDKTYYIVDGYTYTLSATALNPEAIVEVVSFDGKRVPEIELEEQRRYDEMFSKQTRNLSVDSEMGKFTVSLLAHDFIVLQYDIERGVYAPKHAATTRLFLLYAADKAFFAEMSAVVLAMHTSTTISTMLYSQADNTTIAVSAFLLELLHPDQETRRVQRETLVAHNLDVIASKGLVHAMRDTEYRYIEIEQHDYDKHFRVFVDAVGREPAITDFLY